MDNNLRRANIKIKNLKENQEGEDLVEYLQELFQNLAGSENTIDIKLESAFRIGYKSYNPKRPRAPF